MRYYRVALLRLASCEIQPNRERWSCIVFRKPLELAPVACLIPRTEVLSCPGIFGIVSWRSSLLVACFLGAAQSFAGKTPSCPGRPCTRRNARTEMQFTPTGEANGSLVVPLQILCETMSSISLPAGLSVSPYDENKGLVLPHPSMKRFAASNRSFTFWSVQWTFKLQASGGTSMRNGRSQLQTAPMDRADYAGSITGEELCHDLHAQNPDSRPRTNPSSVRGFARCRFRGRLKKAADRRRGRPDAVKVPVASAPQAFARRASPEPAQQK